MKSHHSNGPNPKRIKIESGVFTSSKPESKDPFLTLPSDILVKIIGYIPIAQWHALELVDKNFRANTLLAWRQLRNINVDRELLIKSESVKDRLSFSTTAASIKLILQKLSERSQFLTSLSGIDVHSSNPELNAIDALAQFEHLQSITMGDGKFFHYSTEIPLEHVVDFLESTQSRTTLKALQLYRVKQWDDRDAILERFATSFVNGREIRAPLQLEKFSFSSFECSIRLDTLDTTRLTDIHLAEAMVEPDQLTDLIQRATNLAQMELRFVPCRGDCNGLRLQANKNVLSALASHENLTAVRFGTLGGNYICKCTSFAPEFIEMLKAIGRRGKLRKLAMEAFCIHTSNSMDVICATICEHMPHLQSIKIYGLTQGRIVNILSLTELVELRFANGVRCPLTECTAKQIAQLPHLKRLAIRFANVDTNSLKYLADASTLTDFRIDSSYPISADVFDKWSEGFIPNLKILMLGGIGHDSKADEEGLIRMLEKARRLRVLILERRITEQLSTTIAKSCPELIIFGVRDASTTYIKTAKYLQAVVDNCPKLTRLGGFREKSRNKLRVPKYRKIGDVDIHFWIHDFEGDEYD